MTTHAKLVSRDMFQKRIASGDEIHVNELLYPILQGYDSVMLDSDLTVVGSDQLFNEMMGRFFQERFGQEKQVVMTTKITKGLWGEEKQSKSIGNFVALSDTSKDKFGKIMQLSDDRIIEWMEVYTDITLEEIAEIKEGLRGELNPRDAKMKLAHAIVERYHGKEIADKEQSEFIATFSKREFPDDASVVTIHQEKIGIVDLIYVCTGTTLSKTKIRGLINQNAVTLDDQKITDPAATVVIGEEMKLKVGKRLFFKVVRG
jgi:tyrosyl-tRNA synthetase